MHVLAILHVKWNTCTITAGEEGAAGTSLTQIVIESISCITSLTD